jgi:ribonuclease P protein component|tara:strand:- start:776 stop:1213 length:438 start_codon:yes stop_codon:yes gene_type:complete
VVENFLKEEDHEKEKILQFPQLLKKKENKILSMKSKILALSKNEEFKNLLKKKKVTNKYVTIFFGQLVNKNNKRFNISFVTKKKLGNAVKRNKIKRRLRDIMNDAFKKISIKLNYSYLVIAKPTMLNNDFKDIKETMFKEFNKIK